MHLQFKVMIYSRAPSHARIFEPRIRIFGAVNKKLLIFTCSPASFTLILIFGVIQSSSAHLKRSPLLPKHRQIVLPFANVCEIRPATTCPTSCKPRAWTIAPSSSPPANNPSRKASRDSSKSKVTCKMADLSKNGGGCEPPAEHQANAVSDT